ncbi:MAG: branched-chain amino acid ABC transporter permease [Deinococcota bacterium]
MTQERLEMAKAEAASMEDNRGRNTVLAVIGLGVLIVVLALLNSIDSSKLRDAIALFAIWGIATVSLNLINGITGILSLGHHGFMLIGGYTTALLLLDPATKANIENSARSQMTDFTLGLGLQESFASWGLGFIATDGTLWVRFLIAILLGGLLSALVGLIVGFPSLRLRGDYLAIVTFGFGEIIRLLASTRVFAPFTNGALGFQGVPSEFGKSVWWTCGLLALTVAAIAKLKYSSFGRALLGIREDEIAAEAMGVDLAYHKVFAFALSAFFAGIAGGLWVSWLGGARLDFFLFQLTFFFLVSISVGGVGSITGVLLGTALVVFVRQYGDPLEQVYSLDTWVRFAGVVLLLAGAGLMLYRSANRTGRRLPKAANLWVVGSVLALVFLGLNTNYGALGQWLTQFGRGAYLWAALPLLLVASRTLLNPQKRFYLDLVAVLSFLGLVVVVGSVAGNTWATNLTLVPLALLIFLPSETSAKADVYWFGALGLIALLLGSVAIDLGVLQTTFRGFGIRAIFLSVLLTVTMIFRPEGILGRAEFSWAWLFNERRDKPNDEERAQDAWLSNPELNQQAAQEAS